MTDTPPTPLPARDYDAIEAAVMETERGRWFLAEYAARNRSADTRVLLDAIGRLETVVKRERSIDDVDSLRLELIDMKTAIERTKQEIADLRTTEDGESAYVNEATAELDAIVEQTEKATQDILNAAETIQEVAWTLRESDIDAAHCDTIDVNATEIYMACSFQDLTGQRTKKVVDVLRYLENHINRMIDIWGFEEISPEFDQPVNTTDTRPDAHLLNGPQLDGQGIDQADVDELFGAAVADNTSPEKAEIVDVDIDRNEADVFSSDISQAAGAELTDAAPEPTEADDQVAAEAGTPDADWYDEQLAEIAVADNPEASETEDVPQDDEQHAAVAVDIDDGNDDPTAHLTAGERLALFS